MKKRIVYFGITGALLVLLLVLGAYFFPPGRFRQLRQAYQQDRARKAPISTILWKTGQRIWYGHSSVGELKVGDPAPNVRFLSPDGKSELRLLDLLTDKPLVLILGSYT